MARKKAEEAQKKKRWKPKRRKIKKPGMMMRLPNRKTTGIHKAWN
jgi:hypothetical protein